jgi:hypothetical protein
MAIFSGKIVDAYYTDPDLKFIEIVYEADEQQKEAGVNLLSHALTVDDEDQQYNDLMEEWTLEALDSATKARNEQYRNEFRVAFHNYATEHGLYQHGNPDTHHLALDEVTNTYSPLFDVICNFDEDNSTHKEELFKLKLKMFEQEHVEDSVKKEVKSELRKAKTVSEAIVAYNKF